MIDRATLRPARPGLLVRMPYPSRECLPAEGRSVTLTPWWRAKMNEGDVEIVIEQPDPPKPEKPAAKTEKKGG